jgi:hypothetical protein
MLGDRPKSTRDAVYKRDLAPTVQPKSDTIGDGISTTTEAGSSTSKLPQLVIRINKTDKDILDELIYNYGESIATIMGKSTRLYRGIVDAAEQGGKLIMTKSRPLGNDTLYGNDMGMGNDTIYGNDMGMGNDTIFYETVIAVREQFADKKKTPIAINRVHISPSKGLKTYRIALRVTPAIMEGLLELKLKTGLSASTMLRDGMHLYGFIKRESKHSGTSFYIGDELIDGI